MDSATITPETIVCKLCKSVLPYTIHYFYVDNTTGKLKRTCKKCSHGRKKYGLRSKYTPPKCRKCKDCQRIFPYSTEYFYESGHKPKNGGMTLYTRCKECYLKQSKKHVADWRVRNKEKHLLSGKQWREENPEQCRETARIYSKNPNRMLSNLMRGRILRALRDQKQGRSWENIVGYSLQDLKQHLESQFLPGMTWEDRSAWHIDHIRPIASFSYTSYEDASFLECWGLDNLQPLWAADNQRKWAH